MRLLLIAMLLVGCRIQPKSAPPTKDHNGCPIVLTVPIQELYQPFAQQRCNDECPDAEATQVNWSCYYYRCTCSY